MSNFDLTYRALEYFTQYAYYWLVWLRLQVKSVINEFDKQTNNHANVEFETTTVNALGQYIHNQMKKN